jgi:toxin ParE1/3/4
VIIWTENAVEQLDNAHAYISVSKSAVTADEIVTRIVTAVDQLARFPVSGRAGRVAGARELVVPGTPYLVAYSIDKDRIAILALCHGAQRWPAAF